MYVLFFPSYRKDLGVVGDTIILIEGWALKVYRLAGV